MTWPRSFLAFCTNVTATMVCARLLVAFMLVEAIVLFFVPSAIRSSMSWKFVTGIVRRPSAAIERIPASYVVVCCLICFTFMFGNSIIPSVCLTVHVESLESVERSYLRQNPLEGCSRTFRPPLIVEAMFNRSRTCQQDDLHAFITYTVCIHVPVHCRSPAC